MVDVKDATGDLDKLVMDAMELCGEGERVVRFLKGHHTFYQDSNEPGDIRLVVPAEADFNGVMLNLYLSARRVNRANPDTASELTYRPADWTHVRDGANTDSIRWLSDCLFEMRTPDGAYCNSALPVSHVFSGRTESYTATQAMYPYSSWIGAKRFGCPLWVERGKSVTIALSPRYSIPLSANSDTASRYQLRVTALLRGSNSFRGVA